MLIVSILKMLTRLCKRLKTTLDLDKMKQFKSYLLKEDIKDILLSDYKNKEMLLDEILDEYLFLINDIRKDELEDIIVNQFESI